MSKLKDILFGKAATASPEVIQALGEGRINFVPRFGGNQRVQYLFDTAVAASYAWFYENSVSVRTVVDLISRNVAQLDLDLYREIDTDEREAEPDHPAADALDYPNDDTSSDQFIRLMFKSWLLYDNAFALKVRDQGTGPLKFVWIPPERVKVQGRGLVPEFYVIQYINGSESEPYPADQMLHWRGESFDDPRIGKSRLETLRPVIAEEAAMAAAIVGLAKSGLAQPTWVSRPGDAPEMDATGVTRFEEHLGNRLRQADRIPPLLEEGMELHGFGVSPRDAQMLEVRKYALQQVASLYGVPLAMVGLEGDLEKAQTEFYSDTLPPICEDFCRQLDLQVVQQEFNETDLCFEFDLDEKMQGDDRLRAWTSAAGVPPFTRNEARARLGLPAVEGGDEPMTPTNMAPGSDPSKLLPQNNPQNPPGAKPADNVMPIQRPNGPDQGGGAREGDPGVKPSAAALTEALLKHLERFATTRKEDWPRWNRELAADFEAVGMNGDADLFAAHLNERLKSALATGDRTAVLNQAKADAPRLAVRWLMSIEEMKALGLPQEAIWERAGYSRTEIDQMRALNLAETLAGERELPEGH